MAALLLASAAVPTAAQNLETGLAPWRPQIHQNQGGGTSFGHHLLWADQNPYINADMLLVQSQDASLYTFATVTHSRIELGDVVGLDWTVAGKPYRVRYTLRAGDTDKSIAAGICEAIGKTPGLLPALLAFHQPDDPNAARDDGWGYNPVQTGCANQVLANGGGYAVVFDQPWAPQGNALAGYSSEPSRIQVTVHGRDGTALRLDGGPWIMLGRLVPGYTPSAGDQAGILAFYGQSGPHVAPLANLQLGAIAAEYAASGTGRLRFATGQGYRFDLDAGLHEPSLVDQGQGTLNVLGYFANNALAIDRERNAHLASVTVGAPSGGPAPPGSVNATNVTVNGAAVLAANPGGRLDPALGGSLVLVAGRTGDAGSEFVWTDLPGDFDTFLLRCTGLHSSTADDILAARFGDGGQPVWRNTGYSYAIQHLSAGGGDPAASRARNAPSLPLLQRGLGTTPAESASVTAWIEASGARAVVQGSATGLVGGDAGLVLDTFAGAHAGNGGRPTAFGVFAGGRQLHGDCRLYGLAGR